VKKKKALLDVKPAKPPKWWPRQARRFAWVGALRGGGWVLGDGAPLTQKEITEAKQVLRFDIDKPLFKVRPCA
jgi:hypothetical protein